MNRKITIAIDGPASSGKGTTAKLLAEKLGYQYLDTGAIYRALSFYYVNKNISPTDNEKVIAEFPNINVVFNTENGNVILNGKDIEKHIRTKELGAHAGRYARNQDIRDFITNLSQQMIADKGVIVDGRDAGANIAPDAELKIYLDASVHERARRRSLDFGDDAPEKIAELEKMFLERDALDGENLTNATKNAQKTKTVIDTTEKTIQNQVDTVYKWAKEIIQNYEK